MKEKILEPLMRPFAKRFFGGRTFAEAFAVGQKLHKRGFGVIFNCVDYEDMDLEAFPDGVYAMKREYSHVLHELARARTSEARLTRAAVSIKPSQFGLRVSSEVASAAILDVVRNAAELRIPVEFDREHARDRKITMEIFLEAHRRWPRCRLCEQACHQETHDEELQFLLKIAAPIRWTEGAYRDEGVIDPSQRFRLRCVPIRELLARGKDPAFAVVSNERFVEAVHAAALELKKSAHLAMLYGMRPRWQERLLTQLLPPGRPVDKDENQWISQLDIYIPYGRELLPYVSRRKDYLLRKFFRSPAEVWKVYRD